MPVVNDYKCEKHGHFEATEAICPMKACDAEVMLVFLQAPAINSGRTKNIDKTANQLAIDFSMTNIKTAKVGENQEGYYTRKNAKEQAAEERPGKAAIWGGSPQFDMKGALLGRYAKPVRDEQVSVMPSSVGKLQGPRAGSYTADHENLKISK